MRKRVFLILSYFVRYPKLIKIGRERCFFFIVELNEPHSFFSSPSLARIDTSSIFHSACPFCLVLRDVPVFFLPLAPSFCSSFLLLTDYAPVVDAHRHRLPRFASSHLPPFAISFPFPQHSGSKYTLSLLQQSSVSVSLCLPQKSARFLNLPSSSMRFNSIRFALSLFPFRI